MSVIPIQTAPDVSADTTASPVVPPQLHLVPAHDHTWRLRAVEYDELLEVRRYECETCADVLFR